MTEMASKELICSFCGRAQSEVKSMIAGYAGAFICDECIVTSMAMFLKQDASLFDEVIAKAKAVASESEDSD